MINTISVLVGLKNNLDYTKKFYEVFRQIYPNVELNFVSYGSTDGTHEWLTSLSDKNLNYFFSKQNKTFSDTFNKCVEISKKDWSVFLHNDIIVCENFLENIIKYLDKNTIVSYTTIEPPIFSDHERPGKIIKDFGHDLQTLDLKSLNEFTKSEVKKYSNKTESGITFFMAFSKHEYLNLGGLDNLFSPMFCEDDDLILRWKLSNKKLITSLDAICYHFVSKTSRFSEEYKTSTQKIELNSNRNYLRKWGFRQTQYYASFDIGYDITNPNINLIYHIEPLAKFIKANENIKDEYVKLEQQNTSFDLSGKFVNNLNCDVIISFDANLFTNNSLNILYNMNDIIFETGECGLYKIDIFTIEIKNLNNKIDDKKIKK